MRYGGKIILRGDKDLSTDLWTLPLRSVDMTTHRVHDAILLAAPVHANAHAHLPTPFACFTHTVRTKANSVHFSHQSLHSPCISTLLKAIKCGYLNGCPNLTTKGFSQIPESQSCNHKGSYEVTTPRHLQHATQVSQPNTITSITASRTVNLP